MLMSLEVERVLGDYITSGLVNVPDYGKPAPTGHRVKFNAANHPVPSASGLKGVETMMSMVDNLTRHDLVICLISGGGSALMPMPAEGVRLGEKQRVTRLLLDSGARIDEVNIVRKHLSGVKGGRLAERLYPATVVSLMISDVVGDRIDAIASGPTAPDTTKYDDARKVLRKYTLWKKIPTSARRVIEKGVSGLLPETPKPGSDIFRHVHNIIVGTGKDSCNGAARTLRKAGYKILILNTKLQGEARHVGASLANILSEMGRDKASPASSLAIVAGGETTVTLRGKGRGGRNQELVLSASIRIRGLRNMVVAALETDGLDGPTVAAGAIADGNTVDRALRKGLDPEDCLEKNDSYHFFRELGDLIITGPTGTNVSDVVVGIIGHS